MTNHKNPEVLTSKQDGVAVLTLNSPEKRNAITLAIAETIVIALDGLEADVEVKAIIITGSGSAFSAGGDFADLVAAREGPPERLKRIYQSFIRVTQCRVPTIAAVNGPAIGAGLNLALACDIRLASSAARFETRFLKIGLHPGGGHSWMLNRTIGPGAAAAMLLFGQIIDGGQAERIGLVSKCVGSSDVVAEAVNWAKAVAACDRELVINTKETLKEASAGASQRSIIEREYSLQSESLRMPAFERAMAAVSARKKR